MPEHLKTAQHDQPAHFTTSAERPKAPISVVLADDRIAVRRMLRLLLDGEDDLKVVAEAGGLDAARFEMSNHAPDVLVLALRKPNGSSIETICGLRKHSPETEIIVLTMEANPVFARKALDAGALGFVLKEHADGDLPEAVRRAAAGHVFVSAPVAIGLQALRNASGEDRLGPTGAEALRLRGAAR